MKSYKTEKARDEAFKSLSKKNFYKNNISKVNK